MSSLRDRRLLSAAMIAGAVLVLVAGYLLMIGPRNSEADRLAGDAEAIEAQIAQLEQVIAAQGDDQAELDYANLLRLAKAVPDEQRDADVIIELNAAAERSGVEFASISPADTVATGEVAARAYSTTFTGGYQELIDVLARLRGQTVVRDGKLTATGRLVSVDALDFHESADGFPLLEGTIDLSTYAFATVPDEADPAGEESTDAAGEPGEETD